MEWAAQGGGGIIVLEVFEEQLEVACGAMVKLTRWCLVPDWTR